jgi:hypothetical protein
MPGGVAGAPPIRESPYADLDGLALGAYGWGDLQNRLASEPESKKPASLLALEINVSG